MFYNTLSSLIKKTVSIALLAILAISLVVSNVSSLSNSNVSRIPVYSVEEACGNGRIGFDQASACNRENAQRVGADKGIINICGKISNFGDLAKLAYCVASALAYIVLTFAVVRFVWGAFVLLTDTKNGKERAKSIIINSMIAMVVAVLALQGAPLITDLLTGNNN